MKKRKLKKWVKELLIITLIYSIGIGCVLIMVERANQINRSMEYERIN